MPKRSEFDPPFTKREWQHLMGMTAADWLCYGAFLLAVAMYFCPDPVGDAIMAVGALALSIASFVLGWRHEPECSDEFNAMTLLTYPLVPLITAVLVGGQYLVS